MDPANERALELLAEIAGEPIPSGPVPLAAAYLEAVDRVESLAGNRPGADKTWVEESLRDFRAHYARAKPIS